MLFVTSLLTWRIFPGSFLLYSVYKNFLCETGHCHWSINHIYLSIRRVMDSCFNVLAFVSNTSVNMNVQIFLQDSVQFFSIFLSRLAGSYSEFIFNFLFLCLFCLFSWYLESNSWSCTCHTGIFNFYITTILFSMVTIIIYIPRVSAQGFNFSTSCYFLLYW